MAGTGSKDVVVPGAFVPEHRTHSIVDVYHGSDPGFAVNDRPYFRLPWRLVSATRSRRRRSGRRSVQWMPSLNETGRVSRPVAVRRLHAIPRCIGLWHAH